MPVIHLRPRATMCSALCERQSNAAKPQAGLERDRPTATGGACAQLEETSRPHSSQPISTLKSQPSRYGRTPRMGSMTSALSKGQIGRPWASARSRGSP